MTTMMTAAEILLVEDNDADLELAEHALRQFNLVNRLLAVRDGEEALDFLFRRGRFSERPWSVSPRLVLLDLKLPKVDGLEVLRELKGDARTKHIPVVILTSSKEERDLVEAYWLGVNSYIQKPVDYSHFKELVRQVGQYWLGVNQTPTLAAGGGAIPPPRRV